jgi:hypothetical protein
MGLFGFGGKKKDDEPEEVDEIIEMIFEDPEFDDFADKGMVTPTNPPMGGFEVDDDEAGISFDERSTDKLRAWWNPFKK